MNDQSLPHAIATLKAGGREEGRRPLGNAVQASPRSKRGWLRLSEAVDTDEERRFCLARVLSVNPCNALGPGRAPSPLLLQRGGAGPGAHRAGGNCPGGECALVPAIDGEIAA